LHGRPALPGGSLHNSIGPGVGAWNVAASFAGDTFYLPSSTKPIVFAFLANGSFVAAM
jgi:hypothetical protein